MGNNDKCVYCGIRDGETVDHVPPKCFFSKPRSSKNTLTVPCCTKCKEEVTDSKIDQRVWIYLTSLDTTENHPAIVNQIADKRLRSMTRGKGTNLKNVMQNIEMVDIVTPSGIYIDRRPTFDLNQPIFHKFFERMAKALHYVETGQIIHNNNFWWNIFSHSKGDVLKALSVFPKEVIKTYGTLNEFRYVRHFNHKVKCNLILMWFYDGFLVSTSFDKPNKL